MTDAPAVTRPVRVFVLDDHELVRRSLGDLMSSTDDLRVVGEAATAAAAHREIERVRPDLAVLDVVLPDGSGIQVCREVRARHPEIRCLLLTSYVGEEALMATVMAGALGFLSKQLPGRSVLNSIRRAAAGQALTDPDEIRRLLQRLCDLPLRGRDPGQDVPERGVSERDRANLSVYERQILEQVTDAATDTEIAARSTLTPSQVRDQVAVIYTKLGLALRMQARRE